jgi:hypothetical protein
MENKFILDLENKFHGIHTRLKELHFSAPSMSIHKLIDDFDEEFQEFDDALMENAQALWGFIKPGMLNPILPKAINFQELLTEIKGLLVKVKREAADNEIFWSGILNRVDDFMETVNKYIYLGMISFRQYNSGQEN